MVVTLGEPFEIFSNSVKVIATITLDGSETFPLTLSSTTHIVASFHPLVENMTSDYVSNHDQNLGNAIRWNTPIAGPIEVEIKERKVTGVFPEDPMLVRVTVFHAGNPTGIIAQSSTFQKGEGNDTPPVSENTGYKAWLTLEEYYVDNGELTGETKPNSPSDPDYVDPVYDPTSCPLP